MKVAFALTIAVTIILLYQCNSEYLNFGMFPHSAPPNDGTVF